MDGCMDGSFMAVAKAPLVDGLPGTIEGSTCGGFGLAVHQHSLLGKHTGHN